jgi:hypothetical protein
MKERAIWLIILTVKNCDSKRLEWIGFRQSGDVEIVEHYLHEAEAGHTG